MKLTQLQIVNFRGIKQATFSDLKPMVVIAGPNGCGKSTVFDALRLWKSGYASYGTNEIQHWLQEFGLTGRPNRFDEILQKPSIPMTVSATVSLEDSEVKWLQLNAERLIRSAAYMRLNSQAPNVPPGMPAYMQDPHPLEQNFGRYASEVQQTVNSELPRITEQLSHKSFTGTLTCNPDGSAGKSDSPILELIFSIYERENIGIIDYHGPHRTFTREEVGGINLQIQQYENTRQQHALYNYSNKYTGIKAELATAYIRDLIAKSAGGSSISAGLNLESTLEELFRNFIPEKKFKGVQPNEDGSLRFEVVTTSGSHDINDLSSGEKELLYGYLRLRNYAPRNSIILLDEPELHLNPRLTDGLVEFYQKHVGDALNNQLWLVTHSDVILRQAVDQERAIVFHMLNPGNHLADPEQAKEVNIREDIDRAIIDIVGDLATYKPGAKIVFIEGSSPSKFDESLIKTLFPEFAAEVNLISVGSKSSVKNLGEIFNKALAEGADIGKPFAIYDRDSDPILEDSPQENIFSWNRYHIENYLLDVDVISKVVIDLNMAKSVDITAGGLLTSLKQCASDTLESLLRHELEDGASKLLVRSISAHTTRAQPFSVDKMHNALMESIERSKALIDEELSLENLRSKESKVRQKLHDDLDSGEWISNFRGRDILKTFVRNEIKGLVKYEVFRDLIISNMRDRNIQPEGMKATLDKIQAG